MYFLAVFHVKQKLLYLEDPDFLRSVGMDYLIKHLPGDIVTVSIYKIDCSQFGSSLNCEQVQTLIKKLERKRKIVKQSPESLLPIIEFMGTEGAKNKPR